MNFVEITLLLILLGIVTTLAIMVKPMPEIKSKTWQYVRGGKLVKETAPADEVKPPHPNHKWFEIDGIGVWALNYKNAKKKVDRIKARENAQLRSVRPE